jgi:hypothetical protein
MSEARIGMPLPMTRIPCILTSVLAKKTSKNQLTIPKAIVERLPDTEYFDVSIREGEVVLRPVLVTASAERLRVVREKIRKLGLTEKSVEDAIRWTRRRRA